MTNEKGKGLLVSAVLGAAFGAVTALLFAPKSGKELRGDIAAEYKNVSEKTQQLAGQISEKSKVVAANMSQKTQQFAKTTTEWAGKTKGAALQLAGQVKSWRCADSRNVTEEAETAESSVAATTAERDDQ